MKLFLVDPLKRRLDIVHTTLLNVFQTPAVLLGKLEVFVIDKDKVIRFRNDRRPPKSYHRFEGLRRQLYEKHRVPPKGDKIVRIEPLRKELFSGYRVGLTRRGKLEDPIELIERLPENASLFIGLFPRGYFRREIDRLFDERVAISRFPLMSRTVAARIVYAIERSKGVRELKAVFEELIMAKFSLPAELVKAIAKLLDEIGNTVLLIFREGVARFITLDNSKTTAVVVEAEPTLILDEGEAVAAFEADMFYRISQVLKREETVFEVTEEKILISAEGDRVKRFELPVLTEEAPGSKLSREALLQRVGERANCKATVTAEFIREAVKTIKKTLKADTLAITIEPTRVIITAPSALTKVELIGSAGSANVQEIFCEESISQTFPLEYIEAFAKAIKGAVVRLYLSHDTPLLLDAELTSIAYVTMLVAPRAV